MVWPQVRAPGVVSLTELLTSNGQEDSQTNLDRFVQEKNRGKMATLGLHIRWRQLAKTEEKPPVLPAPPHPSVSVHGGHGAEVIYHLMPGQPHSFITPAWLLVAFEFT